MIIQNKVSKENMKKGQMPDRHRDPVDTGTNIIDKAKMRETTPMTKI